MNLGIPITLLVRWFTTNNAHLTNGKPFSEEFVAHERVL